MVAVWSLRPRHGLICWLQCAVVVAAWWWRVMVVWSGVWLFPLCHDLVVVVVAVWSLQREVVVVAWWW